MVYRFIDENKNLFGLRWLCHWFGISPNCYYNYKKDAKREYNKRLASIFKLIKYIYYNNNRVIAYRVMCIFIKRYGYKISNTTMHRYMNKQLHLCAVIMRSKPEYKAGKKHKICDNLLSQNFTVDCKNNNVTPSMSKAGCPYDNVPMERFYNTFKSNFYNVTSFSNVKAMDVTTKFINWYNYIQTTFIQ